MKDKCERCDRYRRRLGIFSQRWDEARVVVMGLAASRTAQLTNHVDPSHQRLLDALRSRLGLLEDECIGDVLIACGLGQDVSPDEVAACSFRFLAGQRLVVFTSPRCGALAQLAGLLDPHGKLGGCVTVTLKDPEDLDAAVNLVGLRLSVSPKPSPTPNRAPLSALAADLHAALGACRGVGMRELNERVWKRRPAKRLTPWLVQQHLEGRCWVAPFRPHGPWPYVVLDLDRHNAMQEAAFEDTLAWVQSQLPHGMIVQSSVSEGAHVYVRLPPKTNYNVAAFLMRAFVTAEHMRWRSETGSNGRRVQAELIEVPDHPPRLPFGIGSHILGSTAPLEDQVREFLAFLSDGNAGDYEQAARAAQQALGMGRRWGINDRARAEAWFAKEELGLGEGVLPAVADDDPWAPLLPSLPLHLRFVAVNGVPTYGSRTRWTTELVGALVDIVPRRQVEDLMLYWLEHRPHVSEDIELHPTAVAETTLELIDKKYNALGGVPAAAWMQIEASINEFIEFRNNARVVPGGMLALRGISHPFKYSRDQLRTTAFFVARGFFEARRRIRSVRRTEFERYTGSNTAHDVAEILTKGGKWLKFYERHMEGRRAKRYEITLRWPVPASDLVLFLPP
jgi:hypothetical protein